MGPPSRKCGSPSRSSTRLVPALSTWDASKSFVDSSTILRFSSLFLFNQIFCFHYLTKKKHICIIKILQERFVLLKMPMLFLLYLFYYFSEKKKWTSFFQKKKKKKKK